MKKPEGWYEKAADKMVRENKLLVQVANEMEIPLQSKELLNIERTKAFQQILWTARNAYYKEIAADPDRDKNSVLGLLTLAADQLMKEGKYKDAAEVCLKIAKVQGWVGDGGTVNVFGSLSERDLQALEEKVSKVKGKNGTVQ